MQFNNNKHYYPNSVSGDENADIEILPNILSHFNFTNIFFQNNLYNLISKQESS